MSKFKDAFVTDKEFQEPLTPDPEYDTQRIEAVKPATTSSPKIYAAMANILKDAGAIGKDQKNQQQGFRYRGIDDVYNALHGLFGTHGVFCTSEVLSKSREERTTSRGAVLAFTCLRMRYIFWATDGSNVSTVVEGEGMDSGDKSSNKAMAVAHKYALLQAFMIPTDEAKDPDAETHEISDFKRNLQGSPTRTEQLLSCATLEELKSLWQSMTPEEHKHYARYKEQRKNEILVQQADKDQESL